MGHGSVLQLSSVPSRSRLPDLVLRLLVPGSGPGPEHTNGRREEGYNLPQQTFLVEPKLPIVCGFDGVPSNDCIVFRHGPAGRDANNQFNRDWVDMVLVFVS